MCQKEGKTAAPTWLLPVDIAGELMKVAVLAESYTLFIILHGHLDSPAMSTGSSQVGTALFPSF
jgi:hypothetical protein